MKAIGHAELNPACADPAMARDIDRVVVADQGYVACVATLGSFSISSDRRLAIFPEQVAYGLA